MARMTWWIRVLCLLGALRVLAFSAAYPVFDYRDEGLHLDTISTFAAVGLPGPGDDGFKVSTARLSVRYGHAGLVPPFWLPYSHLPEAQREAAIEAEARRIATYRNPEVFAPPLYYVLAAAWYRLGQALGLAEVPLVFWVRFLSAPMYGAAVWLACRICTEFHGGRPLLAIAVGLILVALPQDILYTINSDVLSPAAVALALYLLLRWMAAPRPSPWLAAAAGLAASLAMLGKYSNVAAVAAVPAAILLARRPRSVTEVSILLLALALPLGCWMLRCHLVFGDWTALKDKYAQIGWREVPLSESLKHPIFGPVGLLEFLRQLCVTFWRGEIVYDASVQRVPAVDAFYLVVTSLGMLGAAGWLVRPAPSSRPERRHAALYLVAVMSQILFLAAISTRFDYGNYFYPSRGSPYFAMGRLLTGVVAPFAILLAGGLGELLHFTGRRAAAAAAAAVIAIVCLASELYLCCIAPRANLFSSPLNFYNRVLISGDTGPPTTPATPPR